MRTQMNNSPSNNTRQPIVDLPAETGEGTLALNDCWDKIGVTGDGSCIELEKHIHCRNCPVYSNAAAQLLNRSLPSEYRRKWAEHFASPKKITRHDNASVVIFRISNEWFSLPTHVFQEIAEHRTIHSLPHRRLGIALGLVNVRGELLICVSLERLLGMERQHKRKHKSKLNYERLVVAACDGQRYVFPVDEVQGLHRLAKEDLKEPPAIVTQSAGHTRGLFSWKHHTVGLLDTESVFAALNRSLT